MIEHFQLFVQWVGDHPLLTQVLVFLACVAESLIVLGVLVPTWVLLTMAGALIALGSMDFWTTIFVSVAGALVGDSVNYFAGWFYGQRALDAEWAKPYASAIASGRSMFKRHGAKALVIARFVGLVRPFVAGFAGIYRMSPIRFYLVELLACALWVAPPVAAGVVFGASLSLAAEVATRFAVLVIGLLVGLGIILWLVNLAVTVLQRRANDWLAAMLDWSQRHRQVGRLGQWLADSHQPETPALALLALALFLIGWLVLWMWWGWGSGAPGVVDTLAWQGAQDFRAPLVTAFALAIAQFADWQVYGPVALVVLVTLLSEGRTRAAAHWLAAVGFGATLALGLYWAIKVPDPINYFRGQTATRFGGQHLILATVIYAFLPVLLATDRNATWRTVFYGLATVLVSLMLAGGVYLGTVWLSTGLFAVIFGVAWVTVLGIGYRRHGAQPIPAREVLPLALGVLIASAALAGSSQLQRDVESPAVGQEHRVTAANWWSNAFGELPAYRVDASGIERQPLVLQWRGDLERIETALRNDGWEPTQALSWESSLRWLAVSSPIGTLPVPPQLHAGHHQALMLRKTIDDDEQFLLRLWPSGWYAGPQPVWIGSLVHQSGRRAMGFVRYPRNERDYDAAVASLRAPPGFEARRVQHPRRDPADRAWRGYVWLLRTRAPAQPAKSPSAPSPAAGPAAPAPAAPESTPP